MTQLVVDKSVRKRYIATQLLQPLKFCFFASVKVMYESSDLRGHDDTVRFGLTFSCVVGDTSTRIAGTIGYEGNDEERM
ncbi:hypothetical protein AZE42_10102 [Rhizopogon vesiculosus]|uniref:Uncharacterized protein n=1 Tax=Rhizopogon vesiculosus TaxID=180088 RepID=A0A1J8QLQ0_9AGAM|nr:hypothetical protein AZE42_10102 [Rhizopogon vesiculosus]